MNRLDVDGWAVARVDLEHSTSVREVADQCWLFRSPTGWTMVTMSRHVCYGAGGEPADGHATLTTKAFSCLEELADHVEGTYLGDAWVELLDAGWEHDAELYRARSARPDRP